MYEEFCYTSRIITFKTFVNILKFAAVAEAREDGDGGIVLTMAIFNGDIDRLHHLYKLGTRTGGNVKNLLSNIMSSGLDAEFQHGIELPAPTKDADSDDDDRVEGDATIDGGVRPGSGGVPESVMHSPDRKWGGDSSDDDSDEEEYQLPSKRVAESKTGGWSPQVRETDEFDGSLQAGVKAKRKGRVQHEEDSDVGKIFADNSF